MKTFPLAALLLLTACGSAPQAPAKPAKMLPVQLVLVPSPKGQWTIAAKNESGFALPDTPGEGDTVRIQLPQGPTSLVLVADGMRYERPIVLGRLGANEVWQLVGGVPVK